MKLPIEMQKKAYGLDSDDVPEDYQPRGWARYMEDIADASGAVENAIDRYAAACAQVRKMDVPPPVKKIAERGLKTASARAESWNGIADDPYVMNQSFKKAYREGWKPRHIRD